MGKYGAFAYSKSTAELGYSSEHDDPEAAKQEALVNCGEDDAVILCCECDRWLAFAQSASTGGYAWVDREDGPTAAADAVAACQKACGASDVSLVSCYSTNDGQEYTPPKYGAFAYSKASGAWNWSSQHDDPEAAEQEALAKIDDDDAAILCCESDCWLAFAFSVDTGFVSGAGDDGPTAAADAVAACREAGATDDLRLLVCYSTNDGEEYLPQAAGKLAKVGKMATWLTGEVAKEGVNMLLSRLLKGG